MPGLFDGYLAALKSECPWEHVACLVSSQKPSGQEQKLENVFKPLQTSSRDGSSLQQRKWREGWIYDLASSHSCSSRLGTCSLLTFLGSREPGCRVPWICTCLHPSISVGVLISTNFAFQAISEVFQQKCDPVFRK